MASKAARLENEIESNRVISDWSKACKVARQAATRTPGLDSLCRVLIGEKHLEEYLSHNPPSEMNTSAAAEALKDAEKHLEDALLGNIQPSVSLQVRLLLSKLHHAKGDYFNALKCIEQTKIDVMPTAGLPNRTLRLVAEGLAVKGLCLEKIAQREGKVSEMREEIVDCYEKSGDLTLLQLQEKDRLTRNSTITPPGGSSSTVTPETEKGMGATLETAIQRSSIIHIQNGDLLRGIGRFRQLLTAVETRSTQKLRLTLARQLAEVLLRGVCRHNYQPPETPESSANKSKDAKQQPSKYKTHGAFVPTSHDEEALLLLLIGESMAIHDAVLERTPQYNDARLHSFHNATTIYDLLTITLVKRSKFEMLVDSFEKALKFSFDEFHIWYQFALSLMCSSEYARALLVLKECLKLDNANRTVGLLVAVICYDCLHLVDEGISHSQSVVDLGDSHPLAARAYLALGIGFSLKATETKLSTNRKQLHGTAMEAFQKAYSLDKNDHLILYHMALQCSFLRQLSQAMMYVQEALSLKCDHLHSLHLIALLFSAQKNHKKSLDVIEAALDEHPDNFSLLFTKSCLEELCFGVEAALGTCKKMLKLWKELYDQTTENDNRGTGLIDKLISHPRSLAQLTINELSDRDSGRGSVRESIAASRVEQAMSEVASSLNSSYVPRHGQQQSWSIQAQIWIHLTEFYLSLNKVNEAKACVKEAASIFPLSHQLAYMKGRIYEHNHEYTEAKLHYDNAISLNPVHIKTLQHLGNVLYCLGNEHMAEKVLRDAVNADPSSQKTWHDLGVVLESLGEFVSASECLMTAVSLDLSTPCMPFTVLPRSLQS